MSTTEDSPAAESVGFSATQPVAALVKGSDLNQTVYVNFGKGIPIEGEPGKGPHDLLLAGLSGQYPQDASANMSAIGLYGLLAMQSTVIHQLIAALDQRLRRVEDPFGLGMVTRVDGESPMQ
jgi:hypothetical protein